ncbi:putative retinoblastoma binding protein [Schistosoma mansoni]|uniref:putative retinoblastoma binding protein n=1 Tax=Schistosoma mansoni TaxID=6183 RepID=UPI0001A63A6A|nr:putative retinoblastoma binding protein [Schistosoma mansoni]|eukprot:XP_018652498.1 putative retinoblastoma binding protein [Schistosoma mansoni]
MNLELLEAFHQNYPEAADGYLERIKKDDGSKDAGCATYAITLQFNRVGSLLAIGCNDGRIEIWDHVTRRISKVLVAHAHPVCSLSWSRDSKRLLSASTDNTVSIWNVLSSACEQTFQFPCPVMKVQFNARKPDQLLVCPMRHAPVVINIPSGAPTIVQPEDENDLSIVASYDRRGRYIYTGNSKGKVCIYETKDFQLISSFKSTSAANAAIKSIEFARRGEYFLLNCADRVIRVYNCEDALNANVTDPEPIKKLKDLVTGTTPELSLDQPVFGGKTLTSNARYPQEIKQNYQPEVRIGKRNLYLSNLFKLNFYSQQNWSAFAPDFKELDENVEYEERESEFDVEDEDKMIEENKNNDEEEDVEIDIETMEPVQALLSSDEDEECEDILMYLSISPEVDNPDDLSGGEESVSTQNSERPTTGLSNRKRPDSPSMQSNGPLSKHSKSLDQNQSIPPTVSIHLPGAQSDEVHPLVGNRKQSVKSISGTNHHHQHHQHDSSTKLTNQSSTTYGLSNSRKNNTRQRDRVKSRK